MQRKRAPGETGGAPSGGLSPSATAVPPSHPAEANGVDDLVAVLNAIRRGRATSRSEIAERTRFGRAVVTARVSDLLELGLVQENGLGLSTGGRPPRRLSWAADAGRLLVADVGATSIDVALTDLSGVVVAHRSEPADVARGPEFILDRIDGFFDDLVGQAGTGGARLWGIGIGVPGPVEFLTGRPVSPPIMPGWDGFPIRDHFATRYGAPVWVDNDVNVMALGEWTAGAAHGHQNVVFIKIGTGIGAGLISDGVLHRGAQGSAGDVGHIQVTDDHSVVCRCGNVGCLEAVAGGGAIARDAETAARDGRSVILADMLRQTGHVTAKDVARAAARGDRVAVELLSRAGRLVGSMLASVVNFFNPSLIVIGGGVAQSGDQLMASIRETIYRRSLPLATRDLIVTRSVLGERAGVTGASAMVLDELFAPQSFAQWVNVGHPGRLHAPREPRVG
jgi:glucokinase-like ROK family protein